MRSLAAINKTDVLLIGIDNKARSIATDLSLITGGEGIHKLLPAVGRHGIRSLYLRSAAAKVLDIDPNELQAGLRTVEKDGVVSAEIFSPILYKAAQATQPILVAPLFSTNCWNIC